MRVLWLCPWLRPLARVHAEALQSHGCEVMLITAALHPESDSPRDYEVELLGRPIPHRDWLPFIAALRQAKRFNPDVVVTEFLRDPRWRLFGRLAPRARMLHDAQPHDVTQRLPWWNRLFFERWDARADATIVFSDFVQRQLSRGSQAPESIFLCPLTSDLDQARVPEFVPANERRDFLLVGRQYPYKNHKVVFAAWEAHVSGSAWQGDQLVLLGDGDVVPPLPPETRWERGAYTYRQMAGQLAAAKGSIVHSRAASQSGVQVLSLQLGVPTLVSDAGALPQYQPDGLSVTGIDDVGGLLSAIDALADSREVAIQSRLALNHYNKYYSASVVGAKLSDILGQIAATDSVDSCTSDRY